MKQIEFYKLKEQLLDVQFDSIETYVDNDEYNQEVRLKDFWIDINGVVKQTVLKFERNPCEINAKTFLQIEKIIIWGENENELKLNDDQYLNLMDYFDCVFN